MKSSINPPKTQNLRGDLAAGPTNGLVRMPDAMASANLAHVKPVNGLLRLERASGTQTSREGT